MPVQAWWRAGAALALAAALVPRLGAGIQPVAIGHLLTNHELRNISSVDCLKAKQEDPGFICEDFKGTNTFTGTISAGNFPDYQDVACKSVNGEFFCDPDGLLTITERGALASELKRLRYENLVPCGRVLHDKVDPWHLQPFYLGVVLLGNWPMSEADPESLQQFGQIVASQWNMDKKYAGTPPGRITCPNTGVLLVMPNLRQAYLSTASCEFICQAHGGPEVVTATLKSWSDNEKVDGLLAGVRAAYSVLGAAGSVATNASATEMAAQVDVPQESRISDTSGSLSNVLQRIIFGLVVVLFAGSLLTGFLLLLLGPGFLSSRRKH